MSISAKDIQKLRMETGFGIMECKKALNDAKGDFSNAKKALSKEGSMKAEKRKDRTTDQGVVEAYIHDSRVGAIVILGCETDFVAKNEQFRNLAHDLAMQIASMNPKNKKELLAQTFIKDQDMTVAELIEENIGKIGENIRVVDFKRLGL